jgi:hypothetical protein
MDLASGSVIVTGGASGLSAATSRRLAASAPWSWSPNATSNGQRPSQPRSAGYSSTSR